MSNLSELLPSGGGQNVGSFVASGTLTNGQTVGLKTDGKVEAVALSSITEAVGTPTVFESAEIQYTATAFDSNSNKVVIAYRDNANLNNGTAVVGTVSDTSISFGTPVVFQSGGLNYITATFDSSANKVVIAFRDDGNNDYGTAIVGTISGTSISFGSSTVFTGSNHQANFNIATFDSNSNKVVIAYQDGRNGDYGTAVCGTVSGTSISFGSAAVFESAITQELAITFDSNSNKVVIGYKDDGNSSYGTTIVGTVSGDSISFGTAVVFNSVNSKWISATFDSTANKVIIAYEDGGDASKGKAKVGTISGTSISFGSPAIFNAGAGSRYIKGVFDTSANKVVIAYRDDANLDYGTLVVGTVSGTSISFSSETVFESANTTFISAAFDSNSNRVVIAYKDNGNSNYGTSVVFRNASSSTNVSSFIGITGQAISDTATGNVDMLGGINSQQTSLTIGSKYYVQDNGTLGTTVTSTFAGQAVSATTLNIRDLT